MKPQIRSCTAHRIVCARLLKNHNNACIIKSPSIFIKMEMILEHFHYLLDGGDFGCMNQICCCSMLKIFHTNRRIANFVQLHERAAMHGSKIPSLDTRSSISIVHSSTHNAHCDCVTVKRVYVCESLRYTQYE